MAGDQHQLSHQLLHWALTYQRILFSLSATQNCTRAFKITHFSIFESICRALLAPADMWDASKYLQLAKRTDAQTGHDAKWSELWAIFKSNHHYLLKYFHVGLWFQRFLWLCSFSSYFIIKTVYSNKPVLLHFRSLPSKVVYLLLKYCTLVHFFIE